MYIGCVIIYNSQAKRLEVARRVEGVQKTINGLMSGFMEYFYQPIVSFMNLFDSLRYEPIVSFM